MKKALIAGATSAVMAAMPVVGVFAAANPSNYVDTLTVTIADTCTWTRTLVGKESSTTVSNGTAATATVSATMTAGQKIEGFGVSTINVKCNNDKGYKIKGTFTDLAGFISNSEGAAAITDKIEYAAAEVSAGKWAAHMGTDTVTYLTSGTDGNIASTTAADNMTDGSSYVITYDVETAADQSAGYYKGTATYALSQNS